MASFRKLRDDSWGVLVSFTEIPVGQGRAPAPGSTVTVIKRDGSRQEATLGQMVSRETYGWLFKIAPRAAAPATTQTQVGDLSGITTLFERARTHLRHPAIVLATPSSGLVRISVASAAARVPGSLNVTAQDDFVDGRRRWFGRVLQTGVFDQREGGPEIAAQLQRFAANPAQVAQESARLTGRCCFCNRPLDDERSTAVGYGPICADHFGLPWGERPVGFAAAAARAAIVSTSEAASIAPVAVPVNNGEDDGLVLRRTA